MEHSLKKELLQYFAAKTNRTEQEERLYREMQYNVGSYDICSICHDDLANYGLCPDVDEDTMEDMAFNMCGFYLDGAFEEDLFAAAEYCGVKKKLQ